MGRPPAGMIDAMTKHLIRRLRTNHGQEDGDPTAPRKSSSTSSTVAA
jgi:hypothetical protein